jgi:hypothetical protein
MKVVSETVLNVGIGTQVYNLAADFVGVFLKSYRASKINNYFPPVGANQLDDMPLSTVCVSVSLLLNLGNDGCF